METAQSISILVPVWNDWDSVRILCAEIAAAVPAKVWLVDDGSSHGPALLDLPNCVKIIRLREHHGHQRAIAAGLGYLQTHGLTGKAVVVMDGDGEDLVRDVARLIDVWKQDPNRSVAALRRKRKVSWLFRLGNAAYRGLFWLVTGRRFNFGNFLLLTPEAVAALCASPGTTRHLAASVLRLKLPYSTIRADRGQRYCGRSRMSWLALGRHAYSAFAVYFGFPGASVTPTECARELIARA